MSSLRNRSLYIAVELKSHMFSSRNLIPKIRFYVFLILLWRFCRVIIVKMLFGGVSWHSRTISYGRF